MGRPRSIRPPYDGNYPHMVEVYGPEAEGLGGRLGEMMTWCDLHGGDWQSWGGRFYFRDPAIAAEFRQKWFP